MAENEIEIVDTEPVSHVVEVGTTDVFVVEVDEAFPPLGEPNPELRHTLLRDRDLHDQHPITAITGLREELNSIEALQTIYSDKVGYANYYLWEDRNVDAEDRVGFFVTLSSELQTIKRYDDVKAEPFGVVVSEAAFIGGQNDVPRGAEYGLVSHSGMACARCESDVVIGDYVIPNEYGVAEKSPANYGYLVCGIHDLNGLNCVHISLEWSPNQVAAMANAVDGFNKRVDKVEANIVVAMNVANEAHNKASNVEGAIDRVDQAVGKVEDAVTKVEDSQQQVENAMTVATQAKAIAESAATSAESIRTEANQTANDALNTVNAAIKDLAPIMTWEDSETGNTGAEYFVNHINNNLATKTEVQTAETATQEALSAVSQNAKNIELLVSSIDRYSVGEYSQSYGLMREQAKNILKIGIVYIPTKHSDTRSHSETFVGESEPQEFTPGNYYEWGINDQGQYDWIEYGNSVAFFSEEPAPSGGLKYWYVDSNEAPEGYEPYALYMYDGAQWQKVNILDGNINNRITSMIRQTADEVALEVTNARGSAATLGARITNTEAIVENTAQWAKGKTADGEDLYNIATIKQTASDDGSSLALVVADIEGNKVLKGASIVLGQNEEDSYIQFDADVINFTAEDYQVIADNINLKGYATIESLKGEGTTEINGSNIITGSIQSNNYKVDESGMKLNLVDGTWDSKHFKIDSDGNVDITGKITAISGEIGKCTIDEAGNLIVPCANISDLTVDAAKITGKLTASQIETGTITANEIAGKTITAAEIQTGTITAEEIKADTLDAAFMKTTGLFVDGWIDASFINADSISANIAHLAGFSIDDQGFYSGTEVGNDAGYVWLGPGGIQCGGTGASFNVSNNGAMTVGQIGASYNNIINFVDDISVTDIKLGTSVGGYTSLNALLQALWNNSGASNESTYGVYYDANGGYFNNDPTATFVTQSVSVESETFIVISADEEPYRSGYILLGWSTSKYASTAMYVGGMSYEISGNLTLYAVWDKDTTGDEEIAWTCPACKQGFTSVPTLQSGLGYSDTDGEGCETDDVKVRICPDCQSVICECGHVLVESNEA